jgi:alpha-tubulin suppressor-like RCC1 family protein
MGGGGYGGLGDGTTESRYSPTLVTGLSSVTKISAGQRGTCAVLADHTARCWGENDWQELGSGTGVRLVPTAVLGVSDAVNISLGEVWAAAVSTGGKGYSWGYNELVRSTPPITGLLGDPTFTGSTRSAGPISGLTGIVDIGAGDSFGCALLSDGNVWCWGTGGFLGDHTSTLSAAPVKSEASSVAGMSVGIDHTCVRLTSGTAQCWGSDDLGQLGNGTTSTTLQTYPVPVSGLASVVGISAGWSHTCALLSLGGGTVQCWGSNFAGQLGDGTLTDHNVPAVAVPGLTSVVSVAAGGYHTCAVLADGSAQCWGYNDSGQLGDLTTTSRSTPVAPKW